MLETKGVVARVEDNLSEAIAKLDEPDIHRAYWNQNDFAFLPGFIPPTVVETCLL